MKKSTILSALTYANLIVEGFKALEKAYPQTDKKILDTQGKSAFLLGMRAPAMMCKKVLL